MFLWVESIYHLKVLAITPLTPFNSSNSSKKQKNKVKRYCQTMDLKEDPELIKDYCYWHSAEHIWPEIPAGIRAVGIRNMEIYRLGTRLFMIVETDDDFDWDASFARLATLDRQAEWEDFVARFQKTEPGSSSAEKWQLMEQIFKLPE